MSPRPVRRDEGQATVELALILPVVVLLAFAIAQAAVVARDHILVVHAARAAGREAAVTRDQRAVRSAVEKAAPALKAARVSTETSYQGGEPGTVTVRVRYLAPTSVPLVGAMVPDVAVVAKAAFRDESGHGAS